MRFQINFQISVFLVLLFLIFNKVYGQNDKQKFTPFWEFNVNGGLSTFIGDIKQNSIFPDKNEWKFGVGAMFGRQISKIFGLRMQILAGDLYGHKQERDRYFEASYLEGNLNTTVNINNIFSEYKPNRFMNFYLVAGVGLTNYKTALMEISTGNLIDSQGYGGIAFSNGNGLWGRVLEGVLIGGFGSDFRINDKLSLRLETVNRGMNTDLMDLTSGNSKFDIYNYTSLGVSLKLGPKLARKKEISQVLQESMLKEPKEEFNLEKTKITIIDEIEDIPLQKQDSQSGQKLVTEETTKTKPFEQNSNKNAPQSSITDSKYFDEKPVVIKDYTTPELEYRIQIRANYANKLSIEMLSYKYNIPYENIKEDIHNGYYIYSIGSLATYDEARLLRDEIRSVNKIYDAFVVAFRWGKRVHRLEDLKL